MSNRILPLPSLEVLQNKLSYSPDTGEFRWLSTGNRKNGKVAGSAKPANKGYVQIRLDGKDYYAHRLAWKYVHGVDPQFTIDHENGNTADNRIGNLRQATEQEQKRNARVRVRAASGLKGVYKVRNGSWVAYITVDRVRIHLGTFYVPEAAHATYVAAAKKYFGSFANDGA